MAEDQKRFPYWDFSWRVIGHALAFLLVPAVLFRILGSVTSSPTAGAPYLSPSGGSHYMALLRSLISGDWGGGSPQISIAFRVSIMETIAALGISIVLMWVFLAAGRNMANSSLPREVAWWSLAPLLLATPVALAPLALQATGGTFPGSTGCFWRHIVLPAILLAFYPAFVAARAALRERDSAKAVPALLHASPNILSGMLVLEPFLGIPGAGRLFLQSLVHADWITAFRVALWMAVITLVFRLLADFFTLFSERGEPPGEKGFRPTGGTWTWGALAASVLLLVVVVVWRTKWAAAAASTSVAFMIVAPLLFVPGVGWGLLVGELRYKGGKARETLASLIAWPVQIFFALPAFYWVLLSIAVAGDQGDSKVIGIVMIYWMFPRLVMISEEAWRGRPYRTGSKLYGWQHGTGMIVSLMAWTVWAGLVGVAVPGFLGMGLLPQEAELGKMIAAGWRSGSGWIPAALALVYVPFLWLTASDRVLSLLKVDKRSGWIW